MRSQISPPRDSTICIHCPETHIAQNCHSPASMPRSIRSLTDMPPPSQRCQLPSLFSCVVHIRYAKKVCKGYRPSRPTRMSPGVWSLIQACWQQDPLDRPAMKDVRTATDLSLACCLLKCVAFKCDLSLPNLART
eukprot:GHUV01034999.1.p1 GENE.GHUV01034999.1~~GHUV01034999.1.p1  ORF type:complete len:135 (+),score=0.74 GHUV01034999.1:113-517(+)